MKNVITAISLTLLASTITFAQDLKEWKIDKAHASVNFSIDHFFTAVTGKFKDFDGTIHFDMDQLEKSKVIFTIKVMSVDTDEPDRDADIKSESFFNATKYPTIKFESFNFVKKSDKLIMVTGSLTMHGKTKTVELPMQIKGVIDNPWKEGSQIMGIDIKTTIDRTDWGIGTGDWAATTVVGDEVSIHISMELDASK